jgi:hypothetical protein
VTRYNAVLHVIDVSCKEMLRAINGFVVMSSEMEQTFRSIINNQVPAAWQEKSYPNLKPLALWVADLLERMKFIQSWSAPLPISPFTYHRHSLAHWSRPSLAQVRQRRAGIVLDVGLLLPTGFPDGRAAKLRAEEAAAGGHDRLRLHHQR